MMFTTFSYWNSLRLSFRYVCHRQGNCVYKKTRPFSLIPSHSQLNPSIAVGPRSIEQWSFRKSNMIEDIIILLLLNLNERNETMNSTFEWENIIFRGHRNGNISIFDWLAWNANTTTNKLLLIVVGCLRINWTRAAEELLVNAAAAAAVVLVGWSSCTGSPKWRIIISDRLEAFNNFYLCIERVWGTFFSTSSTESRSSPTLQPSIDRSIVLSLRYVSIEPVIAENPEWNWWVAFGLFQLFLLGLLLLHLLLLPLPS